MITRAVVCCIVLALLPAMPAADTKSDPESAPRNKEEKPSLQAQLETAKKQLAQLLTQFTEENPRVKVQRRKIADLEEAIAAAQKRVVEKGK